MRRTEGHVLLARTGGQRRRGEKWLKTGLCPGDLPTDPVRAVRERGVGDNLGALGQSSQKDREVTS